MDLKLLVLRFALSLENKHIYNLGFQSSKADPESRRVAHLRITWERNYLRLQMPMGHIEPIRSGYKPEVDETP
jgi:hypothetical protein